MSHDAATESVPRLCVCGLVYFELFVPPGDVDVDLGRERFVDAIDVGLGGALNPASVAAALGIDTTIAHPRGDGLTDIAVAGAIDDLELHSIHWPARSDPATSLVHSAAGDRSFVSCADYEALTHAPRLEGFDWIHVPGLEEAHRLSTTLRHARNSDTTVSVAGSWAPTRLDDLRDRKRPLCDLLILNTDEARRATRADESTSPAELVAALRDAAEDIIVTDGPRAIHAHLHGQSHVVDVPPAESFVDATGAGDAFGAGYVAARLNDLPPHKALHVAARVACTVVGLRGGVVESPTAFDHLDISTTANRASLSDTEP